MEEGNQGRARGDERIEKSVEQGRERSEMRQRGRGRGSRPQLVVCKMGITELLSGVREYSA